jgi:glycosyltransferase involved in cell wall biosynthesis
MKIAYVSMIKDENDIIYYQLNYYKNIGFRDFYIMDNGSTDGTVELVQKFISENPTLNVHLEFDSTIVYHQYMRMNKLANLAFNQGCNWILPVDADELLFHNEKFTDFNIYDFLNNAPDGDYIKFYWWYYRPTEHDDENEINPFLKINHRDAKQQSSEKKVLVRWKPGMEVCQGNHMLHSEYQYKEINELSYKISYAHFWQRSLQQLIKKTVNLGKAYKDIDMSRFEYTFYQSYVNEGEQPIINHFNHYKNEFPQEKFPFPKEVFL